VSESAPAPATEDYDEQTEIFRWLCAERTGPAKPKLSVSEQALLHKAAAILAQPDASGAKDVAQLLEWAPKVINPGAAPQKTLVEVSKPDAEWHLDRLSCSQLVAFEAIRAVAVGAACPFVTDKRRESVDELFMVLDADKPDAVRVRELIVAVLGSSVSITDLYPSHAAELSAERSKRIALEQDVARLQHVVDMAAHPTPANVASLAAARAAREAPTMSSRPALR
jgi:hypothetical protein